MCPDSSRSFEKSQPKLVHAFLCHHPFFIFSPYCQQKLDILGLRVFKDELVFKVSLWPQLVFLQNNQSCGDTKGGFEINKQWSWMR